MMASEPFASPIAVRRLFELTEEQMSECIQVIDAAFEYKFFLQEIGGSRALIPPLIRAHIAATLVDGELWIAEASENGSTVGLALWFGPKTDFLSNPLHRREGWDDVMSQLPDECVQWWSQLLDRSQEYSEQILGKGVKFNSYFLRLLAVSSGFHRRGIASSLMEAVAQEASATGTSLVVETTRTAKVQVYERMGFRYVGEGHFPQLDGTEGTVYILIRSIL